jgi:predicted O-methyltransferase YrrM
MLPTFPLALDREELDRAWCLSEVGGQFLYFTVNQHLATQSNQRVLEIGTSLGYSTLWLAMTGAPIDTIDVDPGRQARAAAHFEAAGYAQAVTCLRGEALTVLPTLPDTAYAAMFLDANKPQYVDYFQHAKRLLQPGGLLIADNTTSHRASMQPFLTAIHAEWPCFEFEHLGSGMLVAYRPASADSLSPAS